MATHNRKIKIVTFSLGPTGSADNFECQIQSWNIENNSDDGERYYAQCPDGEFREEAEPDYALALTFFSDWQLDGISDYLWANDGETVSFSLDHHPDVAGEHVRWTGQVKIKAPNVGGESRTTEMTEVTLPIVGKPVYSRVGA